VAVASFQPAAVVYREEQSFDWRVYALTALAEALTGLAMVYVYQGGNTPGLNGPRKELAMALLLLVEFCLIPLVIVGLLRMTTEVTPTDLRVWFGWVPTYRRFVDLGAVRRIEVVTYRPLADYGGWGIRMGRDGERVFNARGNRGVRLELADGTRLLIGSQRPEALALAIEGSLRPGA
jgi:hypothetical protein